MNSFRAKIGLLLLLAAIVLTYSNHFENSFHFDDSHCIEDNVYIRDLRNLPRFFTDATTLTVLPENQGYRPILAVTAAFDYYLGGGLYPFYFHVSTFVVFLVLIFSVYLMYHEVLCPTEEKPSFIALAALFMAAWFGLHTVCAETVNYICQRTEVYSSLGIVWGLYLFICFPRYRRLGYYLVPVVLGCLAKPLAIMFGPILFVYCLLFEVKSSLCFWTPGFTYKPVLEALRSAAPALITCAGMYVLQAWMTPGTSNPEGTSLARYVLTQPWVYLYYIRSLFLPTTLSADTDMHLLDYDDVRMYTGLLSTLAMTYGLAIASKRAATRPIAFGLSWFFLSLVPTTFVPLAEVANDHRMFLPFMGLILAVVWMALLGAKRLLLKAAGIPRSEGALWVAALVFLAPYGYGAHTRNEVWRNEETLWKDVTEKSPRNGRGLMNYGLTLMAKGDYNAALEYFERARLLTPHYHTLEVNLGIARGALGDAARAEYHFKLAQQFAPNASSSYLYYGRWLKSAGRSWESRTVLETGLSKVPSDFNMRHLLMQVYLEQREWFRASALADESLRIAPLDAESAQVKKKTEMRASKAVEQARRQAAAVPSEAAFHNLSLMLYYAGQFSESIEAAQKALDMNASSADAHNYIAAAFAEMKQWDAAIKEAEAALRLNPEHVVAKNNLAWAKAEKAKAPRP